MRPDFAADVRRGLTSTPRQLHPRYFYDALGSALFTAICELPEYYVTRAEREILDRHAGDISRATGPVDRVIELGSGNSDKTRILIEALLSLQPNLLYQPIDVDASVLEANARTLRTQYPSLAVEPLCADYSEIGQLGTSSGRTLVLFLGSSIGNLDHASSTTLLREIRRVLTPHDAVLIGFDLEKSKEIIEPAYNDALGVTAAFNLNLLARINRELGGTFDLARFSHRAFLNEYESRIEMHLVSREAQRVRIEGSGLDIELAEGETIHTEDSYKYSTAAIDALTAAAGLRMDHRWTDSRGWFTDVLLRE